MRAKDIIIGEHYRLKSHPTYGYVKPLEVLKPKQIGNPNNYIIVKCEHIKSKWDEVGIIKYFKPVDIIRDNE